jgi:hypothetical protein
MRTLSLLFLALSLSCGFTSPGGGTNTLFVVARLASDGSTEGSRARVTVRLGSAKGEVVRNAEVVLRGGALPPTPVPFSAGDGEHQLDGFTWVPGIRLEVRRGNDWLDGAIDAPGASLITEPIADSTFRRAGGAPFIVRWKDEFNAVANRTQVKLRTADIIQNPAPGVTELRLSPTSLSSNQDERIDLERSNEVFLIGGSAGSVLSAQTSHSIQFRVE